MIKDHLGSPRVVFEDKNNNHQIDFATEIEDIKNYYPFGLEWDAPTQELPRYRNAYNDKERTPYTKYLDFGARSYIKSANIFDGPDPISASFPHLTSINYAANRVPNGVDLHGLQYVPFGAATFTAKGFDKKQHRETVNSFLEAQGNLGLVIVDDVPVVGEAKADGVFQCLPADRESIEITRDH